MKILKQYRTEQEASIDSLALKDLGIKFIINKNDGGPYPTLTDIYGYSIYVNDDDFEKAVNGLAQNQMEPMVEPEIDNSLPNVIHKASTRNPKINLCFFLITGFCLGLFSCWAYSKYRIFISDFPVITKRNGLIVSYIDDRNNDGMADYWCTWDKHGNANQKYDNNFDGKIDAWTNDISVTQQLSNIDCDYNNICDMQAIHKNYITNKIFYHPNNLNKVIKYQEYSPMGLLATEYTDTDSIPGMNLMKTYDIYGNVLKETSIKDTLIHLIKK